MKNCKMFIIYPLLAIFRHRRTYSAYFLLLIFIGCATPRQKTTLIQSSKGKTDIKSIAILPFSIKFETADSPGSLIILKPFGIGFEGKEAEEKFKERKIPETLDEKQEEWFGKREKIKLYVTEPTAHKVVRNIGIDFQKLLIKKMDFERVVDPDSVRNLIEKSKIEDVFKFEKIEDFKNPEKIRALKNLGEKLSVDAFIIGSVKKYDTEVIKRVLPQREKFALGKERDKDVVDFIYTYFIKIEAGLFDIKSEKIIWQAEVELSKAKKTQDFKQDVLLAFGSGSISKFLGNYFYETITENTPQKRCIKNLIKTIPH